MTALQVPSLCLGAAAALWLTIKAPSAAEAPSESEAVLLAVAPDAAIELTAHWDPFRESKYGLFERVAELREPKPALARRAYGAADFAALLPAEPVAVGADWNVEPAAVVRFLRQLHPAATGALHHGFGSAPGARACLRALSARHAEVLLRAHAEFALGGSTFITPAQFEGTLVLDRTTGAVVSFRLAVPDRNTNVDVNRPIPVREGERAEPVHFEADIGWIPRLELEGGVPPDAAWERELAIDAARLLLARRFYRFADINWVPFAEAVSQARREGKPLHLVVLFGTLDDESC